MENTVKEFSKNALIKLNRELRDNKTPSAEALCQLQQYRLSHKELTKEVFDVVLEQARLINEERAICAFRIKRLDSIVRKITRLEGSIELKSMGDIAGCRCILDTDDEVYKLMRALKSHPKLSYYIIILFVLLSKSMYKQFAQNDTSFAHISKFSESSLPSPFKPFLKTPSTLKVIID